MNRAADAYEQAVSRAHGLTWTDWADVAGLAAGLLLALGVLWL